MMDSLSYSLWIIPPEHITNQISVMQKRIRDILGGPEIIPHLTIAGGIWTSRNNFDSAFRESLEHYRVSTIECSRLELSDAFFRALYLTASVGTSVYKTRSNIYDTLETSEPEFVPHISLYYGSVDRRDKIQAKEQLGELPAFHFRPSTLCVAINDEANLKWRIEQTISIEQ